MSVYRRSARTMRAAFAVATVGMLCAAYGLFVSSQRLDALNVYIAVTSGTVVWGWLTAGYFYGIFTGPRDAIARIEQARPTRFGERFRLALQSCLYHELLVLGIATLLVAATWTQPNRWGVWMFLALWLMHTSAKLNVFLGVRNFRVDFLPAHLHYLRHLLVQRTSNRFFAPSICVATSVVLMLTYRIIDPAASQPHATGALLVATLILLGIIEHLMLVLPLPVALFGWGLRSLESAEATSTQPVAATVPAVTARTAPPTKSERRTLPLTALAERRLRSHRA